MNVQHVHTLLIQVFLKIAGKANSFFLIRKNYNKKKLQTKCDAEHWVISLQNSENDHQFHMMKNI